MNNPMRIIACLALCLSLPVAALAQQRPLATEDPETIGSGRVLVEGGFSLDKDQVNAAGLTGDLRRVGTFGVSVGVSPRTELQVDGGLSQRFTAASTGTSLSGLEDLVVATKVRVSSEAGSGPAFGLRFGTKLPAAAADKGIGLGTTDFFASFLVAKTVQSVRTVGNVSLFVLGNPEEAQDTVTALGFGVSVARAVTNAFEVVGEVNGRLTPFAKIVPRGLESRGVLRLAGRFTHGMLRLDAGVLAGFTDRDPGFGISAGATYVITR
jgi:hypothetical protein